MQRIRTLLWKTSAQDPVGAAMGLIRLLDREAKLFGFLNVRTVHIDDR